MKITAILVAAVAAFAAVSDATPSGIKMMNAKERIRGVQYRHDIEFVEMHNEHQLQRRFGGSSSTTSTTTTTKTTSTTSKTTSTSTTTKTTTTSTTSATLPPHTTPSGGLTYYGGPVVNNVEVTILTWGSTPQYLSNLQSFYGAVTNSKWFDIMRQYWASTSSTIGSGSYKGTVSLTSSTSGFPSTTSLDDTNDIQPFLTSLVKNGVIKPTANSYFPIHFPSGYSISLGGQGSCSAFCAYHNTIDISSLGVGVQYLYYGVIPDQGGSCAGGCGSNSQTVNNLFSVASHELAEMVTDPAIGVVTGNTVGAPAAWYNQQNGEIGDLCNAQQGSTTGADGKSYVVQAIWSNLDNGCVSSSSKSP